MSFIVLTRNPHSKALIPLTEGRDDQSFDPIREFDSWEDADEAGGQNSAFSAWGYRIFQTNI